MKKESRPVTMFDVTRLIYLHGSESNSSKARRFREWFPGMFKHARALQVRRLIRLAPALTLEPIAAPGSPKPVSFPSIVVQGTLDTVVPLAPVRKLVQMAFANLTYYVVEDDHRLHRAPHELDWRSLFE